MSNTQVVPVKDSKNSLSGQINKLRMTNFKRFLIILGAMFLSAVASRYFVIYANVFSTGTAGIAQGIVYTSLQATNLAETNYELYLTIKNVGYYFVNLTFNLGIMVFAYKKFGKEFTVWSMFAFLLSMGFALFLNYTPGFNSAGFIPGYEPIYEPIEGAEYPWMGMAITFCVTAIAATIGGILAGIAQGMVYKTGMSTMGLDPFSKYISKTKGINARNIFMGIAIVNSMFWILLQAGIAGDITSFSALIATLLGPRMLGAFLYIIVYYLFMNFIHPTRKVTVEVNSAKAMQVSDYLNAIGYHRPHTIETVTGGYTRKDRNIVKVVLMGDEVGELINFVSEVDPQAFIVTHTVSNVYGHFEKQKRYKDKKYSGGGHNDKLNANQQAKSDEISKSLSSDNSVTQTTEANVTNNNENKNTPQ